MRGQNFEIGTIMAAIMCMLMVGVGVIIYSTVSISSPHDTPKGNETLCVTCTQGTLYALTTPPALNDSTLKCHANVSSNAAKGGILMTNVGNMNGICLGYNLVNSQHINLTNTTGCTNGNVTCSYTYDWATAQQQATWDSTFSNVSSGMTLAAVVGIVIAAVAVIMIIAALKG